MSEMMSELSPTVIIEGTSGGPWFDVGTGSI